MEGTIVVQEPRSIKEKFSKWYTEKIIDTGLSKKYEEGFVKGIEVYKKIVTVKGLVVTVVLGVMAPESLPLAGKLVPVLSSLDKAGADLSEKGLLSLKRNVIEGMIVGKDGSSETVKIPDGDIVQDVKAITKDIMAVKSIIDDNKGGKTL